MSTEGNLPFSCVAETKRDHIRISLLFPRPVQKPCCCSHGRPEKQRQLPNHLTPLSSKSGDLTHLHAAALGCLSAGDRQWCNYCFKPTGRWLTGSWAAAEREAWSEEVSSRRRKEDRNGQKMPQVQGMDKKRRLKIKPYVRVSQCNKLKYIHKSLKGFCSVAAPVEALKTSSAYKKYFFPSYLLLLCGGAVDSLVEAFLRLIVAVFVEPDVLCGEALHSTHVGAEEGERGRIRRCNNSNWHLTFCGPTNGHSQVLRLLQPAQSVTGDERQNVTWLDARPWSGYITGYNLMQCHRWRCGWETQKSKRNTDSFLLCTTSSKLTQE